jgi:cytochrome c-type biogenesis protein CcmH
VRERLQAGDSDQQVLDFLTARYGEFVLLRPRFSLHTALLWLTPIGLLLVGGFGLFALSRRRGGPEADLTPGERARVADIVRNEPQAN